MQNFYVLNNEVEIECYDIFEYLSTVMIIASFILGMFFFKKNKVTVKKANLLEKLVENQNCNYDSSAESTNNTECTENTDDDLELYEELDFEYKYHKTDHKEKSF
jgi:hypothetical protein